MNFIYNYIQSSDFCHSIRDKAATTSQQISNQFRTFKSIAKESSSCKVPFLLLLLSLVLFGPPVSGANLKNIDLRINWNADNPLFQNQHNYLTVYLSDYLIFKCKNDMFNYRLYWTKNIDVFNNCDPNFEPGGMKLLMKCSNISQTYKLQISEFSWLTNTPQFEYGKPVYFIDSRDTCSRFNLRLAVVMKRPSASKTNYKAPTQEGESEFGPTDDQYSDLQKYNSYKKSIEKHSYNDENSPKNQKITQGDKIGNFSPIFRSNFSIILLLILIIFTVR